MTESRRGDIFKPGDLLNNTYRIEQMLGRGGTSEVYKARNEISQRFVAIKALKSEFSGDEGFLTLMRREEEIREIRHDAVVRYSENHRTPDGHIYLVMDYVEGPPLDKIMRSGGLPADDLVAVCTRVVQGLRVAHNRNIVHRDLSPDNIILRGGKPEEAVIIDFGIAKDTNPGAETIVGKEFAGKYAYAAPEQLSGNTDRRSDLYSLGALLLATFRGAAPDVGRNPMEVLKNKALPLNTEGVPEPLKSLIDKMSAPEPAARFQTAEELLAELGKVPDEATVIVPRARPVTQPPSGTITKPILSKAPVKAASSGGGSGIWVTLGVLLIAGGGAGAYFSGALDSFLGPRYPVADPYALIVERPEDGAPRAIGSVPSEEALAEISRIMAEMGGTADLSLATGEIAETWATDVESVLNELMQVEQFRFVVNGNDAQVTGLTEDRALREDLLDTFADGLPGALNGVAIIQQGPLVLSADAIEAAINPLADCGPMTLDGAPALGYGPQDTIAISGRLAETTTRLAIFDTITAIAGERPVTINAVTLNPTLCLIEQRLPAAPEGDIGIAFGFGDRPDVNTSGTYFVGENPVIDIVLPADVTDGYLSVSVIDVSGDVFHVLPNVNRTDNAVATLRNGAEGEVAVRVAFPATEAAGTPKLAFLVDSSSLGDSKVIVLHSDVPLFDEMRPTEESAQGYAIALSEQADAGTAQIYSINSRILTTAEQ